MSLNISRTETITSYPNTTSNTTDSDYVWDVINNQTIQAFFCMLYTTIFILGLSGNVLVCYVVGRSRAMQTVTNLFISNLALSDILLCVLCVPFTPLYTFLGSWIFGSALCHVVAFAQSTSVYISTLTLTSIAVDRFFVIVYPFKPRMKLTTCGAIIFCIWTFSVLVTLPYGVYTVLRAEGGAYYCEENWPSEKDRQIYGALTATMQFVVPFIVVAFCYVKVSIKLNDRAKFKPGSKSSRREEADRERKRRTNRMLISMVTIFGVSWMPLNIVNLTNDVYVSIAAWEYFNLCFFVVHALAMSSTCYNPFLYAWLNENFRKEFKQVLPCFHQSGASDDNTSSARGPPASSCAVRTDHSCNGKETESTPLSKSVAQHKYPRISSLAMGSLSEQDEDGYGSGTMTEKFSMECLELQPKLAPSSQEKVNPNIGLLTGVL